MNALPFLSKGVENLYKRKGSGPKTNKTIRKIKRRRGRRSNLKCCVRKQL
jgi:hypothetical protein